MLKEAPSTLKKKKKTKKKEAKKREKECLFVWRNVAGWAGLG